MPAVSVIIPLYNKGRFICRALDSVCAQTLEDFEVIVVDDGSTDNGPELARDYGDARIRLIHQTNAGPGAARNRGVRESEAPYLAFLDADDEWSPEYLQVSVDALMDHPECAVSVTSRCEGASRQDRTPSFHRRGLRGGVWFVSGDDDVAVLEHARAMLYTCAVLCRRDAFEKCGGFYDREGVLSGEDSYLWIQLLVNCKIFITLRPLVWYHCEASDIGKHAADAGVLQPCFLDPGPLYENCPESHRILLDKFLCRSAYARISQLCERGDSATAARVLRSFPGLRRPYWRLVKLNLQILFPRGYQAFMSFWAEKWSVGRKIGRIRP